MAANDSSGNGEIVLACIEEKFFQKEVLIEQHALVKILSGEMRVVQADKPHFFNAGDIVLFPRNTLTTVTKCPKDDRPYRSVLLYISADQLQRFYAKNEYNAKGSYDPQLRIYSANLLFESFFSSLIPYLELTSELPDEIVSIKIEEAISVLRNVDPGTDNLLGNFNHPGKLNLMDFMQKNYMFNLTLDKFCYLTGRSLTTFKKDFKKAFGTTPQRWLTSKRLDLAHHELKRKGRKPIEVYFEVGFENLSHFSYAFKKQFGYSPSDIPA
ncbi:AraC family transcriptional regulator [Pedobacter frigidisoli]|uniref:AraC family transcriptional regulator n=1 Tax=Pedobacter frigidisoli TaxID=2530455 RepID=UPI00292DA839|nr:AraC family transcriptional regulator [Pedobacter frigidisoli]